MYRFLITIEKGDKSYGASAPDLPGCVAIGDSIEEVKERMQVAIEMHLQGIIEDGEPIPIAHSTADYIDITLPGSTR